MKKQDEKKFKELITLLTENFRVPISAVLADEYWRALEYFEIDRVEKAVRDYIQNPECLFRPTVGELLGKVREQRSSVPLLTESEPTEDERKYGQWQCRFALWLMGYKKTGTKRVRRSHGHYEQKSVFRKGAGRWREAETQKGRQNLWNEFCKGMNVPEKVASVPIN